MFLWVGGLDQHDHERPRAVGQPDDALAVGLVTPGRLPPDPGSSYDAQLCQGLHYKMRFLQLKDPHIDPVLDPLAGTWCLGFEGFNMLTIVDA